MTTESTIARNVAMSCEAKKYAYRQSKDGFVLSFVLHPQEVPERLATAQIGARFMLAIVELNDDDTPKAVKINPDDPLGLQTESSAAPSVHPAAEPAPVADPPDRPRAPMSLAQRAGMLCQEPSFWRFLRENDYTVNNADDAANAVREICGVASRADIKAGTPAGEIFTRSAALYSAWKISPAVVP